MERKSKNNLSASVEAPPTCPEKGKKNSFPKLNDKVFRNPDIYAKPNEIIERCGYPCEFHELLTSDGYFISLFRIPFGKNHVKEDERNGYSSEEKKIRPNVLFAHGILNSGVIWVMNSPEKVLPYKLVDKGYDCWLLNARGSEYSKKHSELSVKSRRFWKFGWEEMAKIDLPLVIDYILYTTKQQSLFYIGHSMGCTLLFGAASFNPEIAKKIKLMIACAPAVYLKGAKSVFVKLASKLPGTTTVVSNIYHGEFCLRPSIKMIKMAPWVWVWRKRKVPDATWFLLQFSNLINGRDNEQINWSMLPVVAGHCPSPTSAKTYSHFLQLCKTGEFRQYDFGRRKNLKVYGKPEPPAFDLSKSTFPVGVFYGENDSCIQIKDVNRLISELPNIVLSHNVDWDKWNHLDFLCAKDADKLVYDHAINLMDKYVGN